MPERIQLSRAKGWRMPPNTVRVDRSGPWGNPYRVWRDDDGWYVSRSGEHHKVANQAEGHALAVQFFRDLIVNHRSDRWGAGPNRVDVMKALRGRNLACWCPPGTACHADVLLEIANAPLCEAING